MSQPSQRPAHVEVTYRKMKFDFVDTGFDRYWFDGSPFLSHFWSALSTAFPPGERFFMASATNVKALLDDPRLVAELENFVRQEGHHTYQHQLFNRMVAEHGYDTARLEERFARPLRRAAERLPAKGQLAVTMALEHFTAGFAHRFLSEPGLARGVDPNVLALWSWHAAEEAEHKSTAFDIYEKLGGGYLRRVAVLPVAWGMLVAINLANTVTLLREDGLLLNWRDNLRGLAWLFGRRGFVTGLLPSFLAYFRPGFHPWDEDDSHLITAWQQANARFIQTLRAATSTKAAAA